MLSSYGFFSDLDFFFAPTKEYYFQEDENGKLFLELEMPGVKKDDLKIKIEDNTLKVNAKKKIMKVETDISRKIYLGKSVKTDNVKAKLEDGILRIYFEKPEKKSTEIKIE